MSETCKGCVHMFTDRAPDNPLVTIQTCRGVPPALMVVGQDAHVNVVSMYRPVHDAFPACGFYEREGENGDAH